MTDRPVTEGLAARDLTLAYGPRPIVEGLSVDIPPGRFTVLAGPNGSGKSTLLRGLSGGLKPVAGKVLLDGQPLVRLAMRAKARRIGLLPQTPQAPEGLRVRDLVAHGRHPHRGLFSAWSAADRAACARAMTQTGMTDLADAPLDALSGGQRQRAWIAMTLAQESDILLLDEPTSSLDLSHQLEVLQLIERLVAGGRTVVAVLHDLNQAARHADHVVVLQSGRVVVAGAPEHALSLDVLEHVFGVRAAVLTDPASGRPVFIPHLPG
ncbi:ABC transporter ATP-binding protein [Pseudogemmobacter sonorensis]|uniref:ABC transporter ATP-binding protein n=1 Tax=Pseudogemmobacter sonorensis TaxID=2989681 RepID=UPI003692D56E